MPRRPLAQLPLLLCASLFAVAPVAAQAAPKTGLEVLTRMHDAYATTWYRTLTFIQKTKIDRAGQPPAEQTWYESVAAPGVLRIDIADPDSGNGMIYSTDSTFVFRGGKAVVRAAGGNPFLPLIMGVYLQPPATTALQLAAYHIDLSKVTSTMLDGKPVWIVGAATPTDTTAPQFWVETERLIVLRVVSPIGNSGLTFDARLDGYVQAGKGWLATRVAIAISNGTRQEETYTDWKADPPISLDLFDPARYSTAPHWARP
jgi:hypothetical protein